MAYQIMYEQKAIGHRKLRVLIVSCPPLGIIEPWQDIPNFVRPALAHLAGYLRQFNQFEIKLIDSKFERLDFQKTIQKIVEWEPDVIGFTANTNEVKPCAYVCQHVKKHLPNVVTIIGGVHVTTLPEVTLNEFPAFDIGVIGEGEETLHEICIAVQNQTPLSSIKGIVYREGGCLYKTQVRNRIINLDSLPLPAWDLLPKAQVYYLQTERGCPFNCVFCVNHNGKIARKRSPESVIEEQLLLIRQFQPEFINFGDELFSIDIDRTHRLLDLMIQNRIHQKIKWDCQTHVRYVDSSLFKKMKLANVYEVHMGIETGDKDALKRLGKGTTNQMILDAFKDARIAGVRTGAFFIFGQPNETKESLQNTINFAVSVNPDLPMFALMVPFPGTEVAKLGAQKLAGYTGLSTNWDDYRNRIGGAVEVSGISRSLMDWYIIKGYLSVFLFNGRIWDLIKFLFAYNDMAKRLLWKIITGKHYTSELISKPQDYDLLLKKASPISVTELIESKDAFSAFQKSEAKFIRDVMPELITSQKVIR